MLFMHPWILLGLAGVAVPILFHFLHHRTTKAVLWGAYRFLAESLARRRRRMIVEEYLLLACRTAILLFALLAVARPFVPQFFQWFGKKAARDVVLVIDGSDSMGMKQADGRTNFEIALAEARQLVKDAPRGVAFGVVTGGAVPRVHTPSPLASKREVLALLDGVKPMPGTMNALKTLSEAAMVLAAGNETAKQIVVFGDGQAEGWHADEEGRWKVLADVFAQLPTQPCVVWRTLPLPKTVRNAAVRDVVPSRDVIGLDREVVFRVTVANTGTETVTPREVRLTVDGKSAAKAAVGRIAPGETRVISIAHRFADSGAHRVTALVAADDDFAADDACSVIVHVVSDLRVVVVEGRPEAKLYERAGSYVAAALHPDTREDREADAEAVKNATDPEAAAKLSPLMRDFLVKPVVVEVPALEKSETLADAAVVVLADVAALPPEAASNVAAFVSAGGGLLVVPGAKASAAFYNEWLTANDGPVLPCTLGSFEIAEGPETATAFAPETFTGDSVSTLKLGSDLGKTLFAGRWLLGEREAGFGSVDGCFTDGKPALASRAPGRGRVFLSAVPFDASVSMLPARASFPPLVHELVYRLADTTMTHLNLRPVDGVTIRLAAGGRVEDGRAPGLDVKYFDNRDWRGTPVTDTCNGIDLDWGSSAPHPDISRDNFTVRFEGLIETPESGDWDFQVQADDWGRLWLDGDEYRGRKRLLAHRAHPIRVDYREDGGLAHVRLMWRRNDGPWQTVPAAAYSRLSADASASDVDLGTVTLEAPDGEMFPATYVRTGRGPAIRITRPLVPGFYAVPVPGSMATEPAVQALAGTNGVIPFCVNDAGNEGDAATLGEAELAAVKKSVNVALATKAEDALAAVTGKAFGTEIWRPLAFLAFVLLVLEIALTRWIALGRRTGEKRSVEFNSFVFLTPWPGVLVFALAAAAIAAVVKLYRHEMSLLSKNRARALLVLRIAAILILTWMLAQPTLSWDRLRDVHRRVAVLVDESASMRNPERRLTPTEELDVAQALGLVKEKERPFVRAGKRLAETKEALKTWREILLASQEKNARPIAFSAWRKELRKGADRLEAFDPDYTNLVQEAKKIDEKTSDAAARLALHDRLAQRVDTALARLPELLARDDAAFREGLKPKRLEALTNAVSRCRLALARDLLAGTDDSDSLLKALRARYDVDLLRFGAGAVRVPDAEAQFALWSTNQVSSNAFVSATDVTRALETVIDTTPSEELAGVLLVTDGRSNSSAPAEAAARRYGQAGAPVSTVVLGGTRTEFDLAIADARTSENVFLGDRVRVAVTLLAREAKGKTARLTLTDGAKALDEKTFEIDSDDWTKETRLSHLPEAKGVSRYRVVLETLEGEKETRNNVWDLDVAVSDDRTNVLVADRRPRWEFRYLRNLFYGRDKSVHLQSIIAEPDRIEGEERELPMASAGREFGDAESGALPDKREEWRRFDVIILGDLGEDILTPQAVSDIKYCVEERGAMLVLIAGAHGMPSEIKNPELLELLPVVFTNGAPGVVAQPTEDGFRVTLTPAGRASACMALSESSSENERLWKDLPVWRERMRLEDVKPGAEVLAYAEPVPLPDADPSVLKAPDEEAVDAVAKLAEIRRRQARNAVVVTKGQGRGRVLMLLSPETWRLRYRTGDVYHHRFWGQVLKWGVGEKLRGGNGFVRLGTDALRYAPDEKVRLAARIAGRDSAPIDDADVRADVIKDGKRIARVELAAVKDSNGVYEGLLDKTAGDGEYLVKLDCKDAVKALGSDYPADLDVGFTVGASLSPVEYVHVTSSRAEADRLARLSGGRVETVAHAFDLADDFGEPGGKISEHVEVSLWDRAWLFWLLFVCLIAEWMLRKKGGLA